MINFNILQVLGKQTENNKDPPHVPMPARDSRPVSEWMEGYYSMSFPWLPGFCYGQCDLTVPRVGKNPGKKQWVEHLLKDPSRAFANDPRFLLAVTNQYLRHQALSTGNVFAKNAARDITVGQLKEKLAEGDETIFRYLLSFSKSIPGTRQYWKSKTKEAYSLVNWVHLMSDGQDTFNLFLTLSFADIHIKELHRLLSPDSDAYINKKVVKCMADVPPGDDPNHYITKAEDFKLRSEAIGKNGHIATFFFNMKLNLLLDMVLKDCLGVIDYIIRCEFQYRFAEHFHMVLRLKKGLSLKTVDQAFRVHGFDVRKTINTEEMSLKQLADMDDVNLERKKTLKFFTEHLGLSAIHPEPDCTRWPGQENSVTPSTNCLRIPYSEAVSSPFSHLQDLINLVNRVMLHLCKIGYCLKYDDNGVLQHCRFKYPRKLVGFEEIFDEEDNSHLLAILCTVA